MRLASTLRFMVLFMAISVGCDLAFSLAILAILPLVLSLGVGGIVLIVLMTLLTTLASAWLQSRIIARHRNPLRLWTLATFLGILAGSVLGYLSARQAMSVTVSLGQGMPADMLRTLAGSVTVAACLGAAQALTIWGRRWTSDTLLWLTGLLVLCAGADMTRFLLLKTAAPHTPGLWLSLTHLLSAALVGAGTAWLLDRLVFRVPAGQPFEAGGRTVE